MKAIRRDLQVVFQDPYASLNPRMSVGEIIGEGPMVHGLSDKAKREALVRELLGKVGLNQSHIHRYPARVLGRPAPAHRHRPRPRGQPGLHRVRRAGLGARRVDPEPGPEPARRPPEGVRPHLPVHRPQPRRGRAHQRPRRRHVPRQDGRAGRRRGALPQPAPPVHGRPAVGHPEPEPADPQEAAGPQGRHPVTRGAAVRLPVPHPLLAPRATREPRTLRHRGAGRSARSGQATSPPATSPRR